MNQLFFELNKTMDNHGIRKALFDLSMRIANKIFHFRSLHCIVISKVKDSSLVIDQKFQHGFLSAEQVLAHSKCKENELEESFVRSAIDKGDRCYGITCDGELAAYGWYSKQATLTDIHDLFFNFDPSYVYMYKGFTNRKYRGQRLHAVGMSWALKHCLAEGSLGIVSYVDSVNFDSLKSCYRMGYRYIGAIYIAKTFEHLWCVSSSACRLKGILMRNQKTTHPMRRELEVSSQF